MPPRSQLLVSGLGATEVAMDDSDYDSLGRGSLEAAEDLELIAVVLCRRMSLQPQEILKNWEVPGASGPVR